MKLKKDKRYHLTAGFVLSVVGSMMFTPIIGVGLGIVAGVLKEVKDYFDYGGPDLMDMVATTAGAVAGALLVFGVLCLLAL